MSELIITHLNTCPTCGHYIWAHGKVGCLSYCECVHSRADLKEADRQTQKYRTSLSPGYTIDKALGIVRPPMNEKYTT